MNFLEKLDMLKAAKGLNNHSLANLSGIPYTTIDGWYKKGYDRIKLSHLRRLCDCFEISLDALVRDDFFIRVMPLEMLRIKKDVSEQEVADALDISLEQYQRYENGEVSPDNKVIGQLAEYFDCPEEYLREHHSIVVNKKYQDEAVKSFSIESAGFVPTRRASSQREGFNLDLMSTLQAPDRNRRVALLTPEELSLIEKYRTLDERGRSMVNSVLSNALEWSKPTSQDE